MSDHVGKPTAILLKLSISIFSATVTTAIAYVAFKYFFKDILDPTSGEKNNSKNKAKAILERIGISKSIKLDDYELCIAENLVYREAILTDWDNIGGLSSIIEEIQSSVILPFVNQNILSQSSLLRAPRGVLLYGPPGCGKTMLAKAIASTTDARFLHIQVTSLLDKWYGESEKRVEAVFSLASKLEPTILFFDEVDALFTSRSGFEQENSRIMKTQFMSLWDGLQTDKNSRVLIIGATNRPDQIDKALLRRMPCRFYIPMPNKVQRRDIFLLTLQHEKLARDINFELLAQQSEGLSGSDIREVCRDAVIETASHLLRPSSSNAQFQRSCDDEEFEDALESSFDLKALSNQHLTRAIQKFLMRKDTLLMNEMSLSSHTLD